MELNISHKFRTMLPVKPEQEFIQNEKKEDLTMGEVCIGALLAPGPRCNRCGAGQFPSDTVDGQEQLRRWQLAQKIDAAEGTVELSTDQVTTLKKLIAKANQTIIVGQAFELLDPVGAHEAQEKAEKRAEKKTD